MGKGGNLKDYDCGSIFFFILTEVIMVVKVPILILKSYDFAIMSIHKILFWWNPV